MEIFRRFARFLGKKENLDGFWPLADIINPENSAGDADGIKIIVPAVYDFTEKPPGVLLDEKGQIISPEPVVRYPKVDDSIIDPERSKLKLIRPNPIVLRRKTPLPKIER